MDSKTFARAYAGNTAGAVPARSLRSIAKAKLRTSKAESAAYLARGGNIAAAPGGRGLPPGQVGAIARAVTDCADCADVALGASDRVTTVGRIAVWDLPTRVFHWSLVLAVTVAIVTGLIGGDWMRVHGNAGIAIVGLLGFRLVWGIAGAAHARFASFAPTPARLRAYLGGRWRGHGHNPLGALSVFALLSLLAVQAATGLVGNDEISFQGPLAQLVDEASSLRLTGLHQQLACVLMGLIGLHVLAIAAYLVVRKTNLVKPMVTGWKDGRDAVTLAAAALTAVSTAAHAAPAAADRWHWSALPAALAVGGVAMALASGAGLAPEAPQVATQAMTQVAPDTAAQAATGAAPLASTLATAAANTAASAPVTTAQASHQSSASAAPAW